MRTFPKTFSDILTMKHRWPNEGDRLLKSSTNLNAAASFARHQLARDAYIWDGYMTAGAALIDEAERRPADRDILLYPILFNYRHGLEAAMKWTIEQYGGLAEVSLGAEAQSHDLWNLWKLCKKILATAAPLGADDEAVEQIVKDFHDLDKNAVALRYSKTKNGTTILLPSTPIDLGNVQRVMEAVDNFFKGADGMLDSLESA